MRYILGVSTLTLLLTGCQDLGNSQELSPMREGKWVIRPHDSSGYIGNNAEIVVYFSAYKDNSGKIYYASESPAPQNPPFNYYCVFHADPLLGFVKGQLICSRGIAVSFSGELNYKDNKYDGTYQLDSPTYGLQSISMSRN